MVCWKQGLSLKQQGKICHCFVLPVLLYCYETEELTVADEMKLCGVEYCMIKMRLVDRVVTNILWERVCCY